MSRPFPPPSAATRRHILDEVRAVPVRASRGRVVPRGVKRKMSNFPLRPRRAHRLRQQDSTVHIIVRHCPAPT